MHRLSILHSKAVSWNGALRPWQPMKRATSGSSVKRGCAGPMLTYEDKRCGTTMKSFSGCGKEQSPLKRFIEMFINIPHSGETSQMIQRRTVTSVQLLHRLARLFGSPMKLLTIWHKWCDKFGWLGVGHPNLSDAHPLKAHHPKFTHLSWLHWH